VGAAMTGMCGKAKKVVCIVSGGGLDTSALVHILQGKGVPPPADQKTKKVAKVTKKTI
jgi:asparagine synthetase B (glutamine-hydrolysing)